jgi:phage-related protein
VSFNAGSIDAKLTLDRTSWSRELKKTIAEADKLDSKTITIGIDADSDNFFQHLEAVNGWTEELDGKTATIEFEANAAELLAEIEAIEERLDRLDSRRVVVSIDADTDNAAVAVDNLETHILTLSDETIWLDVKADTSDAVAELLALEELGDDIGTVDLNIDVRKAELMEELGQLEADVTAWERSTDFDIDVNVTKDSYADIAAFMATVEAMDDFSSIDLDVDVDGTAEAIAELELLEAKANDLDHRHIDLQVDKLSSLFEDDGGGGRLGLLRILMYAIIALSPLVSVAIGAMTAAVVGFVGALVGAAGPLLILVGGIALLIKRYKDAKKAGEEMVGPMGDFADALDRFQDALDSVTDSISDAGFALMAQGLDLVAKILPYLAPLFNATAEAMSGVLDQIGGFVDGPGMQSMIQFFTDFGIDMLMSFIRILGNLGIFFGRLFVAMEPFIRKMMQGLEDLTGSWADWAGELESNKAFQHWLDSAAEFGPKVLDMLGSLLDALMAVGHALEPFAGPMLTILTNFFDFIANMDTGTLTILIGALVSLWAGFSIIAPLITSIVSGFTGLLAVIGFILSPIGLIILAIAALAGMFIYLYKTNEDFRNGVNQIWASIKETIIPIVRDIIAFVKENWPAIRDSALDTFNQIRDIVADVMKIVEAHIKTVLRVINFIWKNFGDDILKYTKVAFQLIYGQIKGTLQIIGGIVKVFKGLMTADWKTMMAGLRQIVAGGKTLLIALWNGIKNGILDVVAKISSGIIDGISGAINTVIDAWNGLSFKIPGFDPPGPGPKFGGVTISTPDIPHVAKGGLAYDPTLAVVGDNPGPEPEVIQPLSDLKALLAGQQPAMDYDRLAGAVATALAQALGERGGAAGGGVSPEDLERLIQAASVQVQINASDSGGALKDFVSALMFEFRRHGYSGLAVAGGY